MSYKPNEHIFKKKKQRKMTSHNWLLCCCLVELKARTIKMVKNDFWLYLLYVDGETTLSGGCLFTFGFTLLTCFMELFCAFGCCCCCWLTFNCWFEPFMPPLVRRFRFITRKRGTIGISCYNFFFFIKFVSIGLKEKKSTKTLN